jgi:hypothetical protein
MGSHPAGSSPLAEAQITVKRPDIPAPSGQNSFRPSESYLLPRE